MKLKASFFSRGLVVSDIKRFWWISALYALALFFVLPFNHYIQKFNITEENFQWIKSYIAGDLTFENQTSAIFLVFVPIVIGALVFRFMQHSRSASMCHSLPFTRSALYFSRVISSLILFVAPLFITASIMILLNCFGFLSSIYTLGLIFTWLLYSLLFGVLFLSMSIFVGMFTGNSIAHLAFVYILNFLPLFLVEFIRVNLRELLYGFNQYSNENFYHQTPMIALFNLPVQPPGQALIVGYMGITILLLIGGLFAFKLRRPETAGDIITFRPIKPVFIYGVTTCAALLGGSYFLRISGSSLELTLLGYFISSVLSYAIVQMITNKSFNILHTYKGYIGFGIILIVLALGIKFDLMGYQNKVPQVSEIQEVYMGNNLLWWQHKDDSVPPYERYWNDSAGVYKDPQNIENITVLHRLILDNRSKYGRAQYIAYKLKNGKQLVRYYSIDTDLYASALGPVYESSEYKRNRFPIVRQQPEDIKYIEIYDVRSNKNGVIVSDKPSLDKFKAAIEKDIERLKYRELLDYAPRAITISIVDIKDKTVNYIIRSNYQHTLEWLKSEGIYHQIVLQPEDIQSVVLQKYQQSGKNVASTGPLSIEITDSALIKEIIDLSFTAKNSSAVDNFSVYFQGTNARLYGFTMSFDTRISSELQTYIDKLK